MADILNMVSVLSATTGSAGPIVLGAAVSVNFVTEVQAGAVDQRPVGLHVQEGADWMLVKGTYTASGRKVSIDKVLMSMIGGTFGTTAMTLAGAEVVTFVSLGEDFQEFRDVRGTAFTTDTLVNDDGGSTVHYSNSAAVAVAIAQAGSGAAPSKFKKGWHVWLKNGASPLITVTPATSTINGATTLSIPPLNGALIWSDGANYHALIIPLSAVYTSIETASTDLNTIVNGGMFFIEVSCTNQPQAGVQYYLLVQKYPQAAGYVQQTAWDITPSGGMWTRNQLAGSWSAWVPVLNAGVQTLSAAQKRQAQQNVSMAAMMRGYIAGLTLSTSVGSAFFGIAAGVATDSTNADFLSLTSAFTKGTSAWAVGSTAGALDTGTIAVGWYHVHLIKRPDTGVVDVLISLSATAPTLPTNYTLFRRIGSMLAVAGVVWQAFVQFGDEFLWLAPINEASAVTGVTSATLRTLNAIPTGIKVLARLRGIFTNASGGNQQALVNSPDEISAAAFATAGNGNVALGSSTQTGYELLVRTNTSAQIRWSITSASTALYMVSVGWFDQRGRDQ